MSDSELLEKLKACRSIENPGSYAVPASLMSELLGRLQERDYQFALLRDLLKEAGCPWPDPCHMPRVVSKWLDDLKKGRVSAKGET
jgi:hypothetical protein